MRRLLAWTVPPALVLALGCTGDFFRSCTAFFVGKTVETTKEVTKGVTEGIEEGRKSGESLDGATLVSNTAELEGQGSIALYSLVPIREGSATAIVVALENTTDKPLRFVGVELLALDKEGFATPIHMDDSLGAADPSLANIQALGPSKEVTVPAHAKERVMVRADVAPDKLGTMRIWDTELKAP